MIGPTTPTVSLSRLSSTSFNAAIQSESGAINRLFYRVIGDGEDVTGPTLTSSGNLPVVGLQDNAQYMVTVVSDVGDRLSYPNIGFVSLVSSDTLSAAIRTKWDQSPTLLALGGKLYLNEIPEVDEDGHPLNVPYTYVELGRTLFEWTTEQTYMEINTVEFCTYALGGANAEAAADEVRSIFDWQSLPFRDPAKSDTIRVEPTDYKVESQMTRYRTGEIVFASHVNYHVVVGRKLAQNY